MPMKAVSRIVLFIAIITASVTESSYGASVTDADSITAFPESDSVFTEEAARIIDTVEPDSLFDVSMSQEADSVAFAALPWYKQLWVNGFRIHDKNVNYPAFPRFLLKVYDWGDRTFNSYDPQYVVGSGKNWKLLTNSYNWMESYMLLFSMRSRDMLHIRSEIYNDLGFHLSFMAVGIGYTAKVNNWAGKHSNRSNFNFNFTCSRFSANIDILSTTGDTRITHFGGYGDGSSLHYKFNDIEHKALSGEFYYFLNHRKYSQAAAYCYSKYQLKTAGSAIFGFAFNNQRMYMDFSSLPEDMKKYLPSLESIYRFRYTDYALIAGYGRNWVLHPRRWLINLTLLPSVGYRHSYSDSSEGSKKMLAGNMRLRFAVVYNHKALFASLNGRIDANLYFNSHYTFFNSTESVSMIVGCRF